MELALFQIAVGLVGLYYGAEWLVRGAGALAARLKISPLIIGLTVVAYGTSTPELMVSLRSTFDGYGDLAVGNAVGSNILNVCLILGLAALIRPISCHLQLLRVDTPLMLVFTGLFLLLFLDGTISRVDGAILVSALIAYTGMNLVLAKRQITEPTVLAEFEHEVPKPGKNLITDICLLLVGLVLLAASAHFLVEGAVYVARAWGISEAVIGITIVALGTSLPELSTCLVAAFRNAGDLALGNIIGSNVYNLLGILGVAGLVFPIESQGITWLDLGAMSASSLLLWPMLWTDRELGRREGALLVALYGLYVWSLWPKS
ncbi:MAG: calcium/sodium antiporter [Verrucomicrobiales bacterium]